MNTLILMEPSNQTFQELLGNGVKYTVPRFQRDYAWELEHLEDLWTDIESLKDEQYHYMGYIVLQQKSQHDFEIIDGQQRLVTLSLVVLSAMNQIKSLVENAVDMDNNKQRMDLFSERFIGSRNPVSLRVDNKISLNRNNNANFRHICSHFSTPNNRGTTKTNKLLNSAFNFYSTKQMGTSGDKIAEFIERLTSGMLFTKIIVQDDINAYKVFETLNARGVQLSTPDLLKNYILSIVTREDDVTDAELDDLDGQWAGIISQLGESNFTDFIRYHHNFQDKLVTKKALFKSVKNLANTPEKAYQYLFSLIEYAPIYASLLNPYDEWWQNQPKIEYKEIVKYLGGLKLFNIKQPFTVLMVAFSQFSPQEFIKAVKYLYILSIRYNVICHLSPNEQEKQYNQMAIKVFNHTYTRASHIKNGSEYKKLYPDDDTFFNSFQYHKMPSKKSPKKIRFLLAEIETKLGHKTEYTKTVLEHICPYNPDQDWSDYFGDGVNDIQDRLGNVILLAKDDLKRTNFDNKKEVYLASSFKLADKIASYAEWNIQNVNDYQIWLATQAVKTWKVS
ncbi:RloF [hydrothermal vent metagenome]|uniref:RloF n=1 Tax=hydrothermal vent metagenome TaxID=652676 RepID=A0A3B0W816_9ZZZZ